MFYECQLVYFVVSGGMQGPISLSLACANNIVLDENKEWILIPSLTTPHQLFTSNSPRGDFDFGCCDFLKSICPLFYETPPGIWENKRACVLSALRRDCEDSLLTSKRMFVPVGHPATVPAKCVQLLPDDWLMRQRREMLPSVQSAYIIHSLNIAIMISGLYDLRVLCMPVWVFLLSVWRHDSNWLALRSSSDRSK